MKVPIEIRPNEMRQLENYTAAVVDHYRERDMDEQADEFAAISMTLEPQEDGWQNGVLEQEEWDMLVTRLNVLRPEEGQRVWWLQKKLSNRLNERLREMED